MSLYYFRRKRHVRNKDSAILTKKQKPDLQIVPHNYYEYDALSYNYMYLRQSYAYVNERVFTVISFFYSRFSA